VRSLFNKIIRSFKINIILNEEVDKKMSENKLNGSNIDSIIPLNWKDIETKLLFEYMTEKQEEEKKHEETYKERKI
jgi:hypothetical protein